MMVTYLKFFIDVSNYTILGITQDHTLQGSISTVLVPPFGEAIQLTVSTSLGCCKFCTEVMNKYRLRA